MVKITWTDYIIQESGDAVLNYVIEQERLKRERERENYAYLPIPIPTRKEDKKHYNFH